MPILEFLKDLSENPGRVATEKELSAIQQEALEKFEEGSFKQKLVPEAEQEAEDAGMDSESYISILKVLSNSALLKHKILLNNALKKYKQAYKTPQEMIQDGELNTLAQDYHRLRDGLTFSELALANSSEQELAENPNHRSTFVHRLIENNVKREDLEHYLTRMEFLVGSDLLESYLDLSDNNGITVYQLLTRESGPEGKYQGILDSFPEIRFRQRTIAVDTHTGSIHSSVDRSLLRLAQVYDSSLNIENNSRQVKVNRNAEWSERIDSDIANLERKLRSIISSEASIDEFLAPTLLKIEKREEAREEFKFHAETALRLIEGLKDGSYGDTYRVRANEPVSCGLTPKEVIAISFNSLSDLENWNNPQAEASHFKDFIHHLYIAKRGYNIDKYGDKEWQSHGSIADDNKCTGGMINEIANGLRDHKLVEIKIVTLETMKGPISTKLPDILHELYSEESKNRDLLKSWISNGVISSELVNKILEKLQRDEEFSSPFSVDEINKIGEQVLRQYSAVELKALTESKYPEIFRDENIFSENVHKFVFAEGKGYIPYLENLYNNHPERIKTLLMEAAKKDPQNHLVTSDLLLCSKNESIKPIVKLVDKETKYSDPDKNMAVIYSLELGLIKTVEEYIKNGANINVADEREGHDMRTPLHYAIMQNNPKIVEKLIELGADVNVKDLAFKSPIHYAVEKGNVKIVEQLIKAGANINSVDIDLRTAVHYAVEKGDAKIVEKLIQANANLSIKDKDSKIASDLAPASFAYKFDEIWLEKNIESILINGIKLTDRSINKDRKWKEIEDLVKKIPAKKRVQVMSNILENFEDTTKRDRLVNMLPEHERNLVRAKVSPTMWESIREVTELMYGNSSVEVPQRDHKKSVKDTTPQKDNTRSMRNL